MQFLFLEFPSNRMELNAVFDLFEDPSTGEMLYQLLIEALKSDKMVGQLIVLKYFIIIIIIIINRGSICN